MKLAKKGQIIVPQLQSATHLYWLNLGNGSSATLAVCYLKFAIFLTAQASQKDKKRRKVLIKKIIGDHSCLLCSSRVLLSVSILCNGSSVGNC